MDKQMLEAKATQFCMQGKLTEISCFGNGHINETYLVKTDAEGNEKKYILQKMNRLVFQHPDELMENIVGVTTFLRKKIEEQGGDPDRETLNLIKTTDGKNYLDDPDGDAWRMYLLVEGATCYDAVLKPEDFYETALTFGKFQQMLADYPAETLHETIADFHNTVDRVRKLEVAVKADSCDRVKTVQPEIQFALDRKADAGVLCEMMEKGEIPLRVTHNDTKLNNIMIDDKTGKGLCVIDLDTVMPGLSVNDFGDSIRFGASTGAEDEKDLSKISCDMELYRIFLKGYLEGCDGSLSENEIKMLPMGAKLMTFECGVRFLTDYLNGDTYFHIHYPDHNLDRARTQFKLVQDMEEKWEQMQSILKEVQK